VGLGERVFESVVGELTQAVLFARPQSPCRPFRWREICEIVNKSESQNEIAVLGCWFLAKARIGHLGFEKMLLIVSWTSEKIPHTLNSFRNATYR